ncbi:MAG: hypothetical protein ACI97A_003968 [Planctomycetota bacterium]|jgi:hypothetical protein
MRPNNRHSIFFCLLVTLLCLTLAGQVSEQLPTGGALGYHEYMGELSRPLALSDTIMVVARPSAYSYKDRNSSGLVVYTDLMGSRTSTFIPLPGVFQSYDRIWAAPYRLDDETLIMPAYGPDGVFGTTDDELVMVGNLKTPGLATVFLMPLGKGGIKPGQEMTILGSRTVAFINAFRDSISVSGDQQLTIVHDIGGQAQRLQVIDLTLTSAGGTDGHMVPMGPGRMGMVFCGSDFIWGTTDDVVGIVRLESVGNNALLELAQLNQSLRLPVSGKFPVWLGGDQLMVFGGGTEQGPLDDVELRISGFGGRPSVGIISLHNASRFLGQLPASDSVIDTSGAAMRIVSGPDALNGTFDDQILVRSRDTFEVMPLNAKLAPEIGDPFCDAVPMACGVTVVPMFGRQGYGAADTGVFVISKLDPNGAPRSSSFIPVNEKVVKVVPMTATSAMLFTKSGVACYVDSLDTLFPGVSYLSGNTWDMASEPQVINPGMVVTTSAGTPDGTFAVSDAVVLYKVSAAWNYGSSTPNSQNFELNARCSRRAINVAFPTFDITLDSAPTNQVCALFLSLHRDVLMVAPGALFLLSPETLIYSTYATTNSSGTSSVTLPTPNNGLWFGFAAQYQWFVASPTSARGFELSKGLTVSM